jgi:hypothetical protein
VIFSVFVCVCWGALWQESHRRSRYDEPRRTLTELSSRPILCGSEEAEEEEEEEEEEETAVIKDFLVVTAPAALTSQHG